ncbi:uncharacterized protein LOC117181241 [Belonocnema kinseyi]|uniref:uncharacterized protein LOC117181241 n=1 Tax=Belonocnema kinseyi TaxID=2817044 RepID=UPI00143D06FE|nr:uncharacterized protein LOC117181241 [Belonocnema kinseyi]
MPEEFMKNTIWQHSPPCLQMEENFWPETKLTPRESECTETRSLDVSKTVMHVAASEFNLLSRFSSFRTLKRVVTYLFESELSAAGDTIMKLTQATVFSNEVDSLSRNREINIKSKILNLNTFLENGILKVGGRITHSELPQNQKHPILLPRKHHVTDLIIREKHLELKHAGSKATLYAIRERYWTIDGRNAIGRIIHHCVTCFRAKPSIPSYTLGDLPASCLTFTRPFLNVGIDYRGPFYIKERRYRNIKRVKSYVAVYVCMATKAVHLELVGDLTTEAFIGSLKRFFARCGKSKSMSSDNGTNFVGASRELKELHKLVSSKQHNEIDDHFLQNQEIKWNLFLLDLHIFVGLGRQCPGHFLIGGPLNGLPHEDLTHINPGRLSLWQHAQVMRHHFWSRWHKEYLNELTVRSKWCSNSAAITVAKLVLLKDENLPPLQWNMGRIVSTHPGPDNIVRVVTVKTTSGLYKRCI